MTTDQSSPRLFFVDWTSTCLAKHKGPLRIEGGHGTAALRCQYCGALILGWDALDAVDPEYRRRIRASELAFGGYAVLVEPSPDEIARQVFRVEFHAPAGALEKLDRNG